MYLIFTQFTIIFVYIYKNFYLKKTKKLNGNLRIRYLFHEKIRISI